MFAVVKLWSHSYMGLVVDTVADDFLDIKKAEAFRSEYLRSHTDLDPQNCQVISYSTVY